MWLDASAAAFKSNPKLKLGDLSGIQPGPPGISEKTGRMEVVPVVMSTVDSISSIRIPLPKDLKSMDHRLDVRKTIEEVKRRFPDGIPHLDPIKNMGIKDESFKSLVKKIEVMESRLTANPLFTSPDLERIYNQYQAKVDLNAKIKAQKKKIQAANSVMQLDELKNRKRVLRRLGFTSSNDVIEMKGRVACEISSADELLLTEMIFQGAFNDLTPEQSAALLSCFVLQEKVEMRQPLKDEALTNPLKLMNSIARRIAKVSQESKMPVIEEEYIAGFRPELMDVVYSWAKGATFQEICKKTDIYEGSLIRAFRLLAEVLRQMVQAAKAIGNTELENKFAAAITAIKRDIIFAPSLVLLSTILKLTVVFITRYINA